MKSHVAQDDVAQWVPLVEWLAGTLGAAQTPPGAPSQDAGQKVADGQAVGEAEPVQSGDGSQAVRTASEALVSA
jgi:hypothetical protein